MYGLRVTGDSGRLQVYSEGTNLSLLRKGDARIVTWPELGYQPYNTLEINLGTGYTEDAMVFVRPHSPGVGVAASVSINAQGQLIISADAEYTVNFTWYLFGAVTKQQIQGSSYGLRVYGENSALGFATDTRLLKIVGMLKIADGVDTSNRLSSHTIPLPSGRIYAGHITVARSFIDDEGPPVGGGPYSWFHYDGVTVTQASVGTIDVTGNVIEGTAGLPIMSYGGLLIAADVTGY